MILINIPMPKNCGECRFFIRNVHDRGDDSLCMASLKEAKCGCPLTEIPPHGDLIDRDALLMKVNSWDDAFAVVDAPTIIEADKGDDE